MRTVCDEALLPRTAAFPPPPPDNPARDDLTFREVTGYIIAQSQRTKPAEAPVHPRAMGCCGRGSAALDAVWELICRTSRVSFDSRDPVHAQMLRRVFTTITGDAPPREFDDCAWRLIGFQTDRPERDFRAGGIFTLLVPFWFLFECASAADVFLQRVDCAHFPVMLIFNVITCRVIEAVGETNVLLSAGNEAEMWDTVFVMFAGVVKNIMDSMNVGAFDVNRDYEALYRIINRSAKKAKATCSVGKRFVEADIQCA